MRKRKGILLAGGIGSRLWPLTLSVSKQLLPIYDKPLIYYPLTTLMLANIKDILIITIESEQSVFRKLLKNGNQWGLNIQYEIQKEPKGIAEAFIIGEKFINKNPCALILGDNIFYGSGLSEIMLKISNLKISSGFAYIVNDPQNYGVCKFDDNDKLIEIIEKPNNYVSNWVVTGLYFYDSNVVEIAKSIKPSIRNEIEITSINSIYVKRNLFHIEKLNRGYAWLDAGSPESLVEASQFVYSIEKRQGLKIGCPEEVAWRMKFISKIEFENLIENIKNKEYCDYLKQILKF